MKRLSIAVLSVLILCLASCNWDFEATSVEIPVPEFGVDMGGSSKGLATMPIDYFNGNHDFACTVMTVLPAMSNLRSVKVSLDSNGRIKAGVSLYFHIYGFDLRLNVGNSRLNDDGIYLQYDIMYEGSSVGFIDYYYNHKTNRFTYRQSVLCTFEVPGGLTNNLILNLEYTDIEIKNPLSPEFEAGQLLDDGYLDDNAVIDRFNLGDKVGHPDVYVYVNKPWFTRSFVTTKQVRDKGDFITYSFLQLDTKSCSQMERAKPWSEIDYGGIEAVMSKYVDKNEDGSTDYLIDTAEERRNSDIRLIFDLLPLMYEKGESIVTHHGKGNGGYESYESFNADSFKETLKDEFCEAFNVVGGGASDCGNAGNLVIYNPRTRNGAMWWNISSEIDDITKYIDGGCEKYYGKYEGESDDVIYFLLAKHIRACGIDNDSYISNFLTAYSKRTGDGMDRVRADI